MFEEFKEILKDKKKKNKIILIVVFFFLLLTNPTMNDFRNFVGDKYGYDIISETYGKGSYEISRPINCFIFSIYLDSEKPYIGIAKNFIPLSRSSY
jgi:hypothetical protein